MFTFAKKMKGIYSILFTFWMVFMISAQVSKINTVKHGLHDYPTKEGNVLYEGFESGVFPPLGWRLQASGNRMTWDTASFDPYEGHYYVHCLYDDSLTSVQDEYLITPVLDFSTFTSAVLRFYFQFSKYWGIYPHNNYDLYVLVSRDSGQTFTDTIWNETMVDTSTWDSYEWVKAEVSLNNYVGQHKVALAFVYHGFDGAEAALDQIQIETVGGNISYVSSSLYVYPNPATNYIKIQSSRPVHLKVFSAEGQLMLEKNMLFFEEVNINDLAPGLYFLQVFEGEKCSVLTFVKQ
jgi:hypothetical protein